MYQMLPIFHQNQGHISIIWICKKPKNSDSPLILKKSTFWIVDYLIFGAYPPLWTFSTFWDIFCRLPLDLLTSHMRMLCTDALYNFEEILTISICFWSLLFENVWKYTRNQWLISSSKLFFKYLSTQISLKNGSVLKMVLWISGFKWD